MESVDEREPEDYIKDFKDAQEYLGLSDMIGDASGNDGQFSDTDKKTAENFGIDYIDVDDFVKLLNLED